LHWQHDDARYELRLEAAVASAPAFEWHSIGSLDAAGVAPDRFVDRRRGRGAQAANFQRDIGKLTFSGPSLELPLPPGAQDRLSWMPQLAGIVAAEPARWRAGERIRLFVAGARGEAELWTFSVHGPESLLLPGEQLTAWKLVREPDRPYGTRVDVWLDPGRHYFPVRARLSNGDSTTEFSLVPGS
jgi:hypothetical protein